MESEGCGFKLEHVAETHDSGVQGPQTHEKISELIRSFDGGGFVCRKDVPFLAIQERGWRGESIPPASVDIATQNCH